MRTYFENLSIENAFVLCSQLKCLVDDEGHKLKIAWSFEWFKYIKNHPEKTWNYNW